MLQTLSYEVEVGGELPQRLARRLGAHAIRDGAELLGPLTPVLCSTEIRHDTHISGLRLDLSSLHSSRAGHAAPAGPAARGRDSTLALLLELPHAVFDQLHRPPGPAITDRLEPLAVQSVALNEERRDLVEQVRAEVLQGLYAGMRARFARRSRSADRFALNFRRRPLLRLDAADEPCPQDTAGNHRKIHQDKNVERVPVFADRRGNEAEVEGKRHAFRQGRRQLEAVALLVVVYCSHICWGCTWASR
jgi:hypothetical protein